MSIDIINLIESNPITKFNGNYQSKLIEKIKNNFNNYEQQMFLSSFYCYLNYNKTDFVIDLDNIWQWLGFSQKVSAKNLLEKQFIINKDYTLLLYQQVKQCNQTKGGHNKETFMLNLRTFKLFCIKAGTKKADEIHEYFIKLEEILQEVLIEESDELKQQFIQLEDKKEKELHDKLSKQKILEREKILLQKYATSGTIFYIIKIKTLENGQYIVKVGESRRGIKDRYAEHKTHYDECLLLDCFSVNKSKDFESYIKGHELIKHNKVCDLPGHKTELELFLIGKNLSYTTLLNIITNNIKYFNDNNTSKLELEIEQLKTLIELKNNTNDNLLIHELIQIVKTQSSQIDKLENTVNEVLHKFNSQQTNLTTRFNEPLVTIGPRLQKINPDTLALIKVYETVSEAMKENSGIKRPSINKAIGENTIYCGFRWLLVERNLDPNIIHHIEPTELTKVQNIGYIAKLNIEKNEIINVYLDRKTAANCNGYESISGLDTPVKNFTLTHGSYYLLYNKCDEELKTKFIQKNNGIPLLYKNGVGQFNTQHNLVREFSCKYECIRELKISDKTLAKSLKNNIPYNNHYYKKLGSKIRCL